MSRERYNLLDTVRGVLIINMILYHALYDVVHIMGIPISWYTGPVGYIWQQSICWGFILLSGFCFRLSRRPLRHGLTVLGAGILVTFFLTREVPSGYIGFEGLRLCPLPPWLYQWDFLAVLGLPGPGFWSSDYFPLIPWLCLYLCGYFLWRLIGSRRKVMDRLRPGVRPLAFVGRHSLVIYLLHQPVLMGIFTAAQLAMGIAL